MTSTEEQKAAWKKTIFGDGGDCPCCERWGKVYARAINETMAASLAWLYDANTEHGVRAWIDVPNTAPVKVIRSNQLPTLRWWGLVERQLPEPGSKQKHSGMWRITLRGADFVEGKVQVPKKVFTYNGEVVDQSAELTDFLSCRKVKFDYDATMTETNVAGGQKLVQLSLPL